MEEIAIEKCLDTKKYNSEQEKINEIVDSTNNFDFLSFYNSNKDLNALIVITPEQTLILSPVHRHAYAMDLVYKMLYGISIQDGFDPEDKTNNITIRLVTGESIQIQSFYPEKITLYQKETVDKLINGLTEIKNEIKFDNMFDQMIFAETYEDSVKKKDNITVVDELDKNIIKDRIILEHQKNLTK